MNKREHKNVGTTLYTDTLGCGLTLSVVPTPELYGSTAMVTTRYGGAMRRFEYGGKITDTPAGVAHFLEHKMFDLPDANADELFSESGARANAYTSFGVTAYHYSCTEGFYENLKLLLRMVSVPYFTAESIAKEQGIIGQEISMCDDDPGTQALYGLLGCLYPGDPIADNIVGTARSIAEITPEILYACHGAFYAPGNMTLAVVGNVEPEKVREIALGAFGTEYKSAPKPIFDRTDDPRPTERRFHKRLDVSAPQFIIGTRLVPAPPGRDALLRELTADISLRCLTGRSSDFYSSLYEEGLLRTNFGTEFIAQAGTETMILEGESPNPEAVLERLISERNRAAKDGLSDDAFERAKRSLYGDRLAALEDADFVCDTLSDGALSGYDPLDAFGLLVGIEKADCEEFISASFDEDRLAMAVVD